VLSRRVFLLALPIVVGGCATAEQGSVADANSFIDSRNRTRYAAIHDDKFPVAAVNLKRIDPKFLRQEVAYQTSEHPGTIIVDPQNHFLYLVLPEGRALRYGVGVGRDGFSWNGAATIARKAQWPTWTPPAEMIARDPSAAPWAKGMPGGPKNPLGARALYLYQNGRDTLYRIHGTSEPWSIGKSMSSGCIRLLNQDIIDLYRRVPIGSRTVVLPSVNVSPTSSVTPASHPT
jgi:lipoprotein-anchoring transpeptidase ErfK/SrfK